MQPAHTQLQAVLQHVEDFDSDGSRSLDRTEFEDFVGAVRAEERAARARLRRRLESIGFSLDATSGQLVRTPSQLVRSPSKPFLTIEAVSPPRRPPLGRVKSGTLSLPPPRAASPQSLSQKSKVCDIEFCAAFASSLPPTPSTLAILWRMTRL